MPTFGCVGITAMLLDGEPTGLETCGVGVGEPRLDSWLADGIVDPNGGAKVGWVPDGTTTPGLPGVSLASVVLKDVGGIGCVMGEDPVKLSFVVTVMDPCSGATPLSSEGTAG